MKFDENVTQKQIGIVFNDLNLNAKGYDVDEIIRIIYALRNNTEYVDNSVDKSNEGEFTQEELNEICKNSDDTYYADPNDYDGFEKLFENEPKSESITKTETKQDKGERLPSIYRGFKCPHCDQSIAMIHPSDWQLYFYDLTNKSIYQSKSPFVFQNTSQERYQEYTRDNVEVTSNHYHTIVYDPERVVKEYMALLNSDNNGAVSFIQSKEQNHMLAYCPICNQVEVLDKWFDGYARSYSTNKKRDYNSFCPFCGEEEYVVLSKNGAIVKECKNNCMEKFKY